MHETRASRTDVRETITDDVAWMRGWRPGMTESALIQLFLGVGSALRDASPGERPMREIVDGQLARPSSHG